jgi:segregation and condensation protein B
MNDLPGNGTPTLRAAIEAVLLVADEPVPASVLAEVAERPRSEVEEELQRLAGEHDEAESGFDLRELGGGWRFYTRPECAAYVERFVQDGRPVKLSRAALETLAIVAYRQPITRGAVARVRGVSVDAVIRTLLARGLVDEVGAEPVTGAMRYRTTPYFLERLGLASLTELPPLTDFLPDHTELLNDASS